MTIYAYLRISTHTQNNDNQRFEINQFCELNSIKPDKWIEEVISSGKELKKRKLSTLLKKLKKDDLLIACEISRLGRSVFEVMEILSRCMSIGCRVWTIKDNYRLGNDLQSKVLAFAFSLSAEIEKSMISQRTKQSLARLKAQGKTLGRQLGSKNKTHKLVGKEKEIKELLAKGVSKSQIARLMKCHRDTVCHLIETMILN